MSDKKKAFTYDGTQIDYEEYIKYKSKYDGAPDILYTASDMNNKEQRERENEVLSNIIMLGGSLSAGAAITYKLSHTPAAMDFIRRLPGANTLQRRLYDAEQQVYADSKRVLISPSAVSRQSISSVYQSMLLTAEELTPLHLGKTLQLSSALSPFIETTAQKTAPVFIPAASLVSQRGYYSNLIANEGRAGRVLTDADFETGAFLHGNKLYAAHVPDPKTKRIVPNMSDVLLEHATLVTGNISMGLQNSPNRVLSKFAQIHGSGITSQVLVESQVIVGARNKATFLGDWARAYGRFSMEIGYKTLDNPLGGLEELLSATGLGTEKIFQNKAYQWLKSKANINLGTGGVYDLSTRDSLKMTAKNMVVKGGGAFLAYEGLNSILSTITPQSSPFHEGIMSGLSSMFANAHVGFASVWSDKFQGYKKAQEEAAPESTSLLTLAAFPAAGALLGANTAYMKRMYDSAVHGLDRAAGNADAMEHGFGSAGKILTTMGKSSEKTSFRARNSTLGALIGAAVTLPYLPGALIGESSTELKNKYSGKTDVAVRENRFWLAGGTAYEGEKIKYFKKSYIAESISNANEKALYKSAEGARDLNPLYSPLRYLRNPYEFEAKNKDYMPYPVWGMNVTSGSFLGKIYQGTLGEIIKPTVINPEFLKHYNMSPRAVLQKEREAIKSVVTQDKNKLSTLKGYSQPSTDGYVRPPDPEFEAASQSQQKTLIDRIKMNEEIIKNYKGDGVASRNTDYSIPIEEKRNVRQLVQAGMMLRRGSPSVDRIETAGGGVYTALGDFAGLKGFSSSLGLGAIGLDPANIKAQLAVSGGAVTARRMIMNLNSGDALGIGEFQRRFIPTSAATNQEEINPMFNKAPSWLPNNEAKYYLNFRRGNMYQKVENGEVRLPGHGYATLNKQLQGVDPEKYPMIHQYRILSDVAQGSPEQIAMQRYINKNINSFNKNDQDLFWRTVQQEKARKVEKRFYEYKTEGEKKNFSVLQEMQNSLWNTVAHNSESVLEPLTPFRPAAKLLHQRTAIEDYQKTQLQGSDVGIWTNPYSHFIKPSANRVRGLLPGPLQKPSEALEKERVDEYFDKLAFLKARRNGSTNDAMRTVIGSSYNGVYDKNTMDKLRAALPEGQSAYLDAFSKEKDPNKRRTILQMLPRDIQRAYSQVWKSIDAGDAAKHHGGSVEEATRAQRERDTARLARSTGVSVSSEFMEKIRQSSSGMSGSAKRKYIKDQMETETRMLAAEKEASNYVKGQTGIPSNSWIGWDPRLTMNDIKLRTLTVGREDVHRFGFWKPDIERDKRMVALDGEQEVTKNFNRIRQDLNSQARRSEQIRTEFRKNGFDVYDVSSTPSSIAAVRIKNSKEERGQ